MKPFSKPSPLPPPHPLELAVADAQNALQTARSRAAEAAEELARAEAAVTSARAAVEQETARKRAEEEARDRFERIDALRAEIAAVDAELMSAFGFVRDALTVRRRAESKLSQLRVDPPVLERNYGTYADGRSQDFTVRFPE